MSLLPASLSLFTYVLRSTEVLKIDLLLETEKQAFLFKLNWVSGEGGKRLVLGRQMRDWLQLESRILFVIIDLPCGNHWLSDLVAFKVPWKREKEIVGLDRKFCLEKSMLVCACGGKYLCVHAYSYMYMCVPVCFCVHASASCFLAQLCLLQEIHPAPLSRAPCSVASESHLQKLKWHCILMSLLVIESPSL